MTCIYFLKRTEVAYHIKMYKTGELVFKNANNVRNCFQGREILLSATWGEIVVILLKNFL